MNRKQALWASLHDWWISSHKLGSIHQVVVWCDDSGTMQQRTFSDYDALRAWAGY